MIEKKYIWQSNNYPNFIYEIEKLKDLLEELNYYRGVLDGFHKVISKDNLNEIQSKVLLEDALNTSEIEGEILSRESVRSSILKKIGLEQPQQDTSTIETDGLVDILLDATTNYSQELTKERLFSWHQALFPRGVSGLKKISVGTYRGEEEMQIVSGPIHREKVHFIAPGKKQLEKDMELLLNYVYTNKEKNQYIKSAISHLWFVIIHPFEDGNGRIARAISDYILAGYEKRQFRLYSISSMIKENRKEYYSILEKITGNGIEITEWIQWFLLIIIESQKNVEKIVNIVLRKNKFWHLHKNTELNSRQSKALNRLLDEEEFSGGLNIKKYSSLTRCTKEEAKKDLDDMVSKKCLKEVNSKRYQL